jgi:hypothetical protein
MEGSSLQVQLHMRSKNDRVEGSRSLNILFWIKSGLGKVSHVSFRTFKSPTMEKDEL